MFLKIISSNSKNSLQLLPTIFLIKFATKLLIPFYSSNRTIMEQETILKNVKQIYCRLKEANKQAEFLSNEVKDIRREIRMLSESNLFQDFLDQFNNANNKRENFEDESDNPPNKRFKTDDGFNKIGDYVVVYTDGACENNGRANAKAGIGVWFGDNHNLNLAKPVDGKATNNTAEIQACACALRIAKEQGIKKLIIRTDSQFTISCITNWIIRWKKNNWKTASGGEVKNKSELIILDKLRENFDDIKWEHVAGHQGIKGNEEADKLARQGALNYISK